MGHVWAKAKIGDPDKRNVIEVETLVDTGATLTIIPKRLAGELGLKPTGKAFVESGAGRIELERTRIWIEIEGREEVVPALMSDLIDKILLGVTTLEILGLRVDPLTGKLSEWPLFLY
ncbi:MAG: retroviral-like aspartic protease family protein [Candidatus Bathyarchaeia archaeon]